MRESPSARATDAQLEEEVLGWRLELPTGNVELIPYLEAKWRGGENGTMWLTHHFHYPFEPKWVWKVKFVA